MPVRRDAPRAAGALPWRHAWRRAATGPEGFWRSGPGAERGPAAHFTTSAHLGGVLAAALGELLLRTDHRLGRPDRLDVVDIGAGDGELLTALLDTADPGLRGRLRPLAVDVRPRPAGLDERIVWVHGSAPATLPARICGLLLAHEWLDEIPLDVVEVDDDGRVRLVLVDADGTETLGPALDDAPGWAAAGCDAAGAADWLRRWWPVTGAGARAEVGRERDVCWASCVDRLAAGTALAIDYGHTREQRVTGRYAGGTLAAYLDGRLVAARPDGTVNLTAHVAVDALARAVGGSLTTQRLALRELDAAATLPPTDLAGRDPAAYADALVAASHAAELLDPSGLGSFAWVRVDR